jgi:hypothetical protein
MAIQTVTYRQTNRHTHTHITVIVKKIINT